MARGGGGRVSALTVLVEASELDAPQEEESLNPELDEILAKDYKWGFTTNIESETLPPGLSEDTIRFISAKKNEPEWMLDFRLKAFRVWQGMEEPEWSMVGYPPIDYQAVSYYSASKQKAKLSARLSRPSGMLSASADLGCKMSLNNPREF